MHEELSLKKIEFHWLKRTREWGILIANLLFLLSQLLFFLLLCSEFQIFTEQGSIHACSLDYRTPFSVLKSALFPSKGFQADCSSFLVAVMNVLYIQSNCISWVVSLDCIIS